jgi:RND superfamily putative drug exporter
MSSFLYRVGHWAYRRRWFVLAFWVALLDRRVWWLPRWMDRRLPNLDIEGEKLLHDLDGPASVERERPSSPAAVP